MLECCTNDLLTCMIEATRQLVMASKGANKYSDHKKICPTPEIEKELPPLSKNDKAQKYSIAF